MYLVTITTKSGKMRTYDYESPKYAFDSFDAAVKSDEVVAASIFESGDHSFKNIANYNGVTREILYESIHCFIVGMSGL